MVGDMLETFVDYYNHVMVDLRDPRFVNGNDISDALCASMIDPITCCHLEVEFKSS